MNRVQEKYRTGLERFMDKFPYWPRMVKVKIEDEFEYLGVGAPMVPIGRESESGVDDKVSIKILGEYF